MHPQLQTLADEFHFATARLHALVSAVPAERWSKRNDPARWSVGECVAHLNLTGKGYVPILREALQRATAAGARDPARRYRRDLTGWLLWKMMPPPVRFRTSTPAQFVPESVVPREEAVQEFGRWQEEQLRLLAEADGLPLNEVKVTSPFNEKVKYNLYACFSVLPPHQHRHLWQAEQVWR